MVGVSNAHRARSARWTCAAQPPRTRPAAAPQSRGCPQQARARNRSPAPPSQPSKSPLRPRWWPPKSKCAAGRCRPRPVFRRQPNRERRTTCVRACSGGWHAARVLGATHTLPPLAGDAAHFLSVGDRRACPCLVDIPLVFSGASRAQATHAIALFAF